MNSASKPFNKDGILRPHWHDLSRVEQISWMAGAHRERESERLRKLSQLRKGKYYRLLSPSGENLISYYRTVMHKGAVCLQVKSDYHGWCFIEKANPKKFVADRLVEINEGEAQ